MPHLSKAQIKWVRQLQQKKFRDAEGVFVAEGEKCVNDLKGAFELVLLASSENATPMEIEQMSSLRTPQGVIGVFKKREAIGDGRLGERQEAIGLQKYYFFLDFANVWFIFLRILYHLFTDFAQFQPS